MQTPPYPSAMEAPRAKICKHARLPDRCSIEAPVPNPEPSAWATGKFPPARGLRIVAPSAAFARATQRGPIATTDIQVSDPPAAGVVLAVAAAVAGVVVVVAGVAAVVAGVAADIARS